MEYQLRRYRIRPGKVQECVAAWRASVYPLRLEHGFAVVGAWTIAERNEFIWILGYDGPEGFAAADAAYYASAARTTLTPDPRPFFTQTEQWFMVSVL